MAEFTHLPLAPPIEPMEARPVKAIPKGAQWLYEPKWDGFRCVVFRDGDALAMQSKSGQPLERYFPEIADALHAIRADRFILDGELYIQSGDRLDFNALLQRIHPAASRVGKLAKETPAHFAAFDILSDTRGAGVFERPLDVRRHELVTFTKRYFSGKLTLSPATDSYDTARSWLSRGSKRFDGVIAKLRDAPYAFGTRENVVKIKRLNTADCVVGGFRLAKDEKTIASLLLGLYDDAGLLNLVGFVGSMTSTQRERAAELLKPIVKEPGFTGARPGAVSRWGSRDTTWYPVVPRVVVEVQFDRVTGRRFRHAARLVRWRPDKAPKACTMEQLLGTL